jgi:Kef-type K+ transport system membrane component KefB
MDPHSHPFLFVALVAVLAPLVNELPLRLRIPVGVLEIGLGILIGPQVLDLVRPDVAVEMLWKMGMATLFLLAGMEIDLKRVRGRPLTLAAWGWLLSLALGCGVAWLLRAVGLFDGAALLVGLALATTAVGTLLLSLLPLHGDSVETQTLVLVLFAVVVVVLAVLVLHFQPPGVLEVLRRTLYTSSQLPVRLAVLLAAGLYTLAAVLRIDFLIGAFAAGMIVGLVSRGKDGEALRHKLDGLGFGFLVPIFSVATGVKFDGAALIGSTTALLCVPLFLALFLVVRGGPVFLYRRALAGRDRLALAFYSATALPVVVAVTQIGVDSGRMQSDVAAALLGAAMLSLLVYPPLAMAVRSPLEPSRDVPAAKVIEQPTT